MFKLQRPLRGHRKMSRLQARPLSKSFQPVRQLPDARRLFQRVIFSGLSAGNASRSLKSGRREFVPLLHKVLPPALQATIDQRCRERTPLPVETLESARSVGAANTVLISAHHGCEGPQPSKVPLMSVAAIGPKTLCRLCSQWLSHQLGRFREASALLRIV